MAEIAGLLSQWQVQIVPEDSVWVQLYVGDDLWDRSLKKQMPLTFILVDWCGGNQTAKLML